MYMKIIIDPLSYQLQSEQYIFAASLLSPEECLDEISWPDPTNCSRYYVCAPWGPEIMECPDDLQYNPELQVCDWPATVGCVVSTSTEAPPTIPTVGTRPPEPTQSPPPEPTASSEPEPTTLPEPSSTSPEPEPTETPEPKPTETPEPEPTETPEPESTTAPEPEPTKTTEPEPTGTESPIEPTTIPGKTTTESINPSDLCREYPAVFFLTSYPDECTKFIVCSYGEATVLNCPDGLVFSSILNTCTSELAHCP